MQRREFLTASSLVAVAGAAAQVPAAGYLPLVEDGTWAWLEISDSALFTGPLPAGLVASAFANREFYLVVASYGRTAVEVETTADHVPADQPSAAPGRRWTLAPRSLQILRRHG
jgi:hypothetical protein